jgi:protein-S-isoprenylcysteine O-methyltransferase Ste14
MDALTRQAVSRTVFFLITTAVMIFVPAWSLAYWQGWAYWLIFCAFTLGGSLYFLRHDRALVERRMYAGAIAEKEPTQKIIMALATACMIALVVVPGRDHLMQWSRVPTAVVIIGFAVFVLGFAIMLWTMKANTFAASTITVEQNQHVVSSGPYAVVRHPMYSGAVLMLGATPLALGSYWGLIPAAVFFCLLVARLLHEEQVLSRELPGYDAYCRDVRSRLVPLVW